nr:immunoglobulin light chain junction region [Macaca mulatta]MOX83448.1 immunoglobulin light chain junction region [Macaca mulatta]
DYYCQSYDSGLSALF